MTDNEIIMALENAEYKVNGVVTRGFYLDFELFNQIIDLINRQKAQFFKEQNKNSKLRNERNRLKAENERLLQKLQQPQNNNVKCKDWEYIIFPSPNCKGVIVTKSLEEYDEVIADISTEANKEFAEKLKAEAYNECDELMASIISRLIDNCLKGVEGE